MTGCQKIAAVALGCGLVGCGSGSPDLADFRVPASAVESASEPCLHRDEGKMALFGDLHVHTALSSDAWNYDLEVRPRDSYGYAFGEPIRLPPKDDQGRGTREVRIDRPLDFAAVTDHAEHSMQRALPQDSVPNL